MRIVVHGGAGHTGEVQDGVETAADVGWKLLDEGADAISAAVATVVVLEDDSRFNAGTGACRRTDVRGELAIHYRRGNADAREWGMFGWQ